MFWLYKPVCPLDLHSVKSNQPLGNLIWFYHIHSDFTMKNFVKNHIETMPSLGYASFCTSIAQKCIAGSLSIILTPCLADLRLDRMILLCLLFKFSFGAFRIAHLHSHKKIHNFILLLCLAYASRLHHHCLQSYSWSRILSPPKCPGVRWSNVFKDYFFNYRGAVLF